MIKWILSNIGPFHVLAIFSMVSTLQIKSSEVQDGPFSIPSTAKIVKQCPSGKAEWNRASNVKNCKESQRSLNANVTLVYHCLINEWANATVEVCARRVHVLFGKCAEYNFGAQRIQSSERRVCNKTEPPCPNVYNSTDAYKYQNCYDFSTLDIPLGNLKNATNGTNSSFEVPSPQRNTNGMERTEIIVLIVTLSLVLTVTCISIFIVRRRYKNDQHSVLSTDCDE
ncbi:uncharacterized protein LOC144624037 isoform X2 [Crassostrea virginica]